MAFTSASSVVKWFVHYLKRILSCGGIVSFHFYLMFLLFSTEFVVTLLFFNKTYLFNHFYFMHQSGFIR